MNALAVLLAIDAGNSTMRLVMAVLMAAAMLALALALLLITGDHRSRLERRLTGFAEDDEPEPTPRRSAAG